MEMCRVFSKVLLKFKMAAVDELHKSTFKIFVTAKTLA